MLEIKPRSCVPLRSVCVPFINIHKGRVHDVTYCYNLGKKCVPPSNCALRLPISYLALRYINKTHTQSGVEKSSRVFQLILVKLSIGLLCVFIIISQDAPLGFLLQS